MRTEKESRLGLHRGTVSWMLYEWWMENYAKLPGDDIIGGPSGSRVKYFMLTVPDQAYQ